MSFNPVTALKYMILVNKIRKAIDLKDFDDLERFIDSMFKNAPDDIKSKMREVINRARRYAEMKDKVDLLDLAEDLLSVFGVTGEDASKAAKALTEIAETLANEIAEEMEE